MAKPDAPPGFDPPSVLFGTVLSLLFLGAVALVWTVAPTVAFLAAFLGQFVGAAGLYLFAERREKAVSAVERLDELGATGRADEPRETTDDAIATDPAPGEALVRDAPPGDAVVGDTPDHAGRASVGDRDGFLAGRLAGVADADSVDGLDLFRAASYFFGVLFVGCVTFTFGLWRFL